jgi:hypothetical protein
MVLQQGQDRLGSSSIRSLLLDVGACLHPPMSGDTTNTRPPVTAAGSA